MYKVKLKLCLIRSYFERSYVSCSISRGTITLKRNR